MTHKILVLERNEDLADQVRDVLAGSDEAIEVVSCTRVGSATHVEEHEGPFSVLIAGPSLATRAGLKRLAGLRREMRGCSFIIAFDQRPDASLREIVQVGALDLLEVPVDDDILRQAVKRGLAIAAEQPAGAGEGALEQRRARVFTVCSATGGCGKTFFAANLAMFLAQHSGARVALVDLDLQFGEITTALRLQPPYTIVDAIQRAEDDEEPSADLGAHIEDYLVRYGETFWTLAAPREPSQADEVSPLEATRVIDSLRKRFDYVIVDTPTALAETVLAAFDLSEHLFVLATLDLPSVRNLNLFLQTLQKLQIPQQNVSLVLNKIERDIGIDPSQIARHFPQGFRAMLPYSREVSRSINVGTPVIAHAPGSTIATRLADALADFLPPDDRARFDQEREATAERSGSVLSRFLRRRTPAHATGGQR